MEAHIDLIQRIRGQERMSKGQRRIVEYLEMHYDRAAFLTAAKLGEAAGVSESTVVRFAIGLGYEGYPQFQQALGEYVRHKLNSIQRIEIASDIMKKQGVLEAILMADAEKIRVTMETIDKKAFEQAVDTLLEAKSIYVVGIRSCAPLASFLSFYLNLIFPDVRTLLTSNSSEIFEQMIHIGRGDVIVGISFPRYSMRTLKALEFANNRSARVITITDSRNSTMNLYSSCNLLAKSDMASIVDSLVAPLSVINALIVSLCMKKQGKVIQTLENLEEIWDEYQVYNKDEIDIPEDQIKIKYRHLGEGDE